jgi:hypothetical protein
MRQADHWFREIVQFVCLMVSDLEASERGGHILIGAVAPWKKLINLMLGGIATFLNLFFFHVKPAECYV